MSATYSISSICSIMGVLTRVVGGLLWVVAIANRQYIQKLLQERADRSMRSNSAQEAQTIFDVERDYYQLVYVGWKRNGDRDYGCLLHLDIKDGKIWIQYDGTEGGIANELVALDVPKQDIVLGFQPPALRKFTDFAAS